MHLGSREQSQTLFPQVKIKEQGLKRINSVTICYFILCAHLFLEYLTVEFDGKRRKGLHGAEYGNTEGSRDHTRLGTGKGRGNLF